MSLLLALFFRFWVKFVIENLHIILTAIKTEAGKDIFMRVM